MRVFIPFLLFTATLLGAGEIVGQRAPGFSLPDANYRYHDPQDYRGKILIVEFMQTNCPHCAEFSRILEEVSTKYAGKVAVLSIVNPPDTQQTVSQFVATHKVKNPILFDSGQIAASYIRWTPKKQTSFSVPRVFVIDQNGIVQRDYEENVLTKDIFEGRGLFTELDKMLAPVKPAASKTKK